MAKQPLHLSKSLIPPKPTAAPPTVLPSVNPLSCFYLYHSVVEFRQIRTVPLHTHPFWHLDVQLAGTAGLLSKHGRKPIPTGAVYFIPSHVEHGFTYPPRKSEFLTLKFAVMGRDGGADALFASPTPVVLGLRRALIDATPRSGTPSPAQQTTIELLTAALISHCYPEAATTAPAPSSTLVSNIKEIVSREQGRVPSVKEVARHMGYSISHIAARFRESEGVALKSWLDSERCRIASWRLVYSDLSVGEVAASLEFTDIYSFSRFFKRLSGSSPTEFRAAMLKKLTKEQLRQ